MSIAMMIDNPAGSRDLYERILDNLGSPVPLGGILHLAGPSPTGGWRVIEVWETPEQARQFLTQRFAPAIRAAGFEGPPPTPQLWPLQVVETTSATYERVGDGPGHGGAR